MQTLSPLSEGPSESGDESIKVIAWAQVGWSIPATEVRFLGLAPFSELTRSKNSACVELSNTGLGGFLGHAGAGFESIH